MAIEYRRLDLQLRQVHPPPRQGERFHCVHCGMEIEVLQACSCDEHEPFQCCDHVMTPVNQSGVDGAG